MYSKEITIKFRDADPAGILFFGHILGLAHDAFEDFIESAGFTWEEWFRAKEWIVPIRHAEADYRAPFRPGQKYQVVVSVDSFRETSMKMKYQFLQDQRIHAEVFVVHAFLDAQTQQKIPVPEKVLRRLEKHLASSR